MSTSGKRILVVLVALVALVVLVVLVPAAVASSVAPSFRLPRHSLPHHLEAGNRHYTSIQSAANSESIFDRFWGTDCFSKALQEFSSECRGAHENTGLPPPSPWVGDPPARSCSLLLTPARHVLVRQQICCPRKRRALHFISCGVN
jgi:hypothetical protein